MKRLPQGPHRWIVGVLALVIYLALAGQALAVDQTYVGAGTFGSGPGAGDGELEHPRRVAVDHSNGDVYVADRDNDRIVVFRPGEDPAATYLTAFGSAVLDEPFGVAVDSASGDVYVSSAGGEEIVKFESDGAPTPTFSVAAGFTSPAAGTGAGEIDNFEADIAVDPTSGDLLVADPGDNLVQRYESDGTFVSSFDGSDSPDGAFVGLLDLDVAPNGDVYVVDAEGPVFIEGEAEGGTGPCVQNYYCGGDPSRVERFDSSGAYVATIAPLASTAFGLVAFDPSNGQVLVGRTIPQGPSISVRRADGSGEITSFSGGFTGVYGIAATGGSQPRAYQVTDIVHQSIFNEDVGEVSIRAFEPVNFPSVGAVSVSDVTETTAHLSGSANPNGVETDVRFEYTRDGFNWEALPEESIGDGEAPVTVEADLEGLSPNVHYEVRLRVHNSGGVEIFSDNAEFTTVSAAPDAVTGGAAPRTQTTARINGWVNPLNNETTYYFEWGSTDAYGTTVPLSPEGIGSGEDPLAVSAQLEGLNPGTTYHFRLVAENAVGATFGEDQAFTTRTAAETGPRKRGIELVNNPDKGNQPATLPFSNQGPLASPNGDQILWTINGGAPGSSTGTGNIFLAERSSDGWHSRSLLPPPDQLAQNGNGRYAPVLGNPASGEILYEVLSGVLTASPRTFASIDLSLDHNVIGETDSPIANTEIRASDDFSHVYTNTGTAHDATHPPGTDQVYDFGSDPPELVSVLPNGTPPDCGVTNETSYSEFGGGGYEWASTAPGSPARSFFETEGEAPCGFGGGADSRLYMRDLDADVTTLLSGPALPGGPQGEQGAFIRANDDASAVIFTALSRLVPEDNNDVGDIYRYEVGKGSECLTCVGPGGGVAAFSTYERSLAVSDDLSTIYFASSNQLVPGEGKQGMRSLYRWHEGEIEYIAPLGSSNFSGPWSDWLEDDGVLFFYSGSPEVTTEETNGIEQIYRYDEADRSIECVTCPASSSVGFGTGSIRLFSGIGSAAEHGDSFVFITPSALEPRDVNGDDDIYEWRNGQVKLVTDGVTQYPVGTGRLQLIGMGEDGSNVLFIAGANLTGYERDNVGQYYVAHAGGGFPRPQPPAAPCGEESCQGPLPATPPAPAPGSQTNEGRGNVTPPKRKPRHKCVKRKGAKHRAAAKQCGKKKSKGRQTNGKRRNG